MISDGAWQDTEYITCDEYDGKNRPARKNFDLKKYISKDSSEAPTYGKFTISTNGKSYMDFSMQLTAVGVRDGSSDKSVVLGTWKAGFSHNLTLLDPKSMGNYTADVVYRIVTVIVN